MLKYLRNHFDLKGAAAPTIVVTIIFFINFFFFGMENTIIGPCVALSFLYFSGVNNHYACMAKTFLIYVAVAAAAWVAGMGLIPCIVTNAAVFFWIVYWLIDEYHPDNYYTPGMAFILFQLSPVTGAAGIATRLGAVAASFAVAFAVLLLLPSKRDKNAVRGLVESGFSISRFLIAAYENRDYGQIKKIQDTLHRQNEKICDEIYSYHYSAFGHSSKINWYCRFVSLFQVFIVLTDDKRVEEKAPVLKNMWRNFWQLFKENNGDYETERLVFKNSRPDIRSFRLRFALRQLIIMTPCMVYGYLCPWGNGFWLPVSVFFMLVPLYENMPSRVKGRLSGTLAGVVLCLVLFTLFPSLQAHIAIMTVLNLLINGTESYPVTVSYLTCAVLALNITPENLLFTLAERLVYTFGGALLTVFASRFVFPIRIKPEADFLMEKLSSIRKTMELMKQQEDMEKRRFPRTAAALAAQTDCTAADTGKIAARSGGRTRSALAAQTDCTAADTGKIAARSGRRTRSALAAQTDCTAADTGKKAARSGGRARSAHPDRQKISAFYRLERDQLLIRSYLLCRRLRMYNDALEPQEKNEELLEHLNEHMLEMTYYLAYHFIGVRNKNYFSPGEANTPPHENEKNIPIPSCQISAKVIE